MNCTNLALHLTEFTFFLPDPPTVVQVNPLPRVTFFAEFDVADLFYHFTLVLPTWRLTDFFV